MSSSTGTPEPTNTSRPSTESNPPNPFGFMEPGLSEVQVEQELEGLVGLGKRGRRSRGGIIWSPE